MSTAAFGYWRGALILALVSGPLPAQDTPQPPAQGGESEVVVQGRRYPAAEAGRAATCEAMMQSPGFRSWMAMARGNPELMPTIHQPTRLPRNPDYTAPPKVPAGSPLPELPKSRFGTGADAGVTTAAALSGAGPDVAAIQSLDSSTAQASGATPDTGANEFESAIAQCRALFQRGSAARRNLQDAPEPPGGGPVMTRQSPFGSAEARLADQRARVVATDTTLPMALALFDQGRFAEAYDYFKQAAAKLDDSEGGDEANLYLGKLSLAGIGPDATPAGAIKWLKRAAEANFNPLTDMPQFDPTRPALNTATGEAAMILASIYGRGIPGVAQDMAQACKWYERAGTVGHVAADKTLGDIYAAGINGVPRDMKKAVAAYRRAARLDLPSAQVALARILEFGMDGVKADTKTAMGWYSRAATKYEDPEAMFALAVAYDSGTNGFKANPANAFALYKSAALKGYPAAKAAVGTYFRDGTIVTKDAAMARRWFESAAKDRDADGMYYLAAMQANASGGPRDLVQAWVWLKRAVAGGQEEAPAALVAVEARMSPADKAAAAAALKGGVG